MQGEKECQLADPLKLWSAFLKAFSHSLFSGFVFEMLTRYVENILGLSKRGAKGNIMGEGFFSTMVFK